MCYFGDLLSLLQEENIVLGGIGNEACFLYLGMEGNGLIVHPEKVIYWMACSQIEKVNATLLIENLILFCYPCLGY